MLYAATGLLYQLSLGSKKRQEDRSLIRFMKFR
jgi:hypothetical protein